MVSDIRKSQKENIPKIIIDHTTIDRNYVVVSKGGKLMKGLLKNNFIGVIENLKLLFPLAIIFGIIVSITGNASLLSIYSLSITPYTFVIGCFMYEKRNFIEMG